MACACGARWQIDEERPPCAHDDVRKQRAEEKVDVPATQADWNKFWESVGGRPGKNNRVG